MAQFGISGIIVSIRPKPKLITKMKGTFHTPTWVGNIVFNKKSEGKQLISGRLDFHNYIKRGYEKETIIVSEAIGYLSNGNTVMFHDLYPDFDEFFVCFIKGGYNLFLMTLGSKTVQEFRASGHDSFLKSRVPLTVTVKDTEDQGKRLVPVNLLPAIR